MGEKNKELPENTVIKIAENDNIQVHNNKRNIDMPLYVDRTAQVMQPKGYLRFHVPEEVTEMKVTIEIPLKDNLLNQNISLEDAMELMKAAGNQIRMTGTYSTRG